MIPTQAWRDIPYLSQFKYLLNKIEYTVLNACGNEDPESDDQLGHSDSKSFLNTQKFTKITMTVPVLAG